MLHILFNGRPVKVAGMLEDLRSKGLPLEKHEPLGSVSNETKVVRYRLAIPPVSKAAAFIIISDADIPVSHVPLDSRDGALIPLPNCPHGYSRLLVVCTPPEAESYVKPIWDQIYFTLAMQGDLCEPGTPLAASGVSAAEQAKTRLPETPTLVGGIPNEATKEKDMSPHALCDDLSQHLALGEVIAFVGAGLSIGADLPGWYELIAELAARIGYELPPAKWATGDALIDAAQAYVNRQGLNSLIRHLKDRLDTTGKQPTAAHRALARLPISLVFTANFDDLLERAFREEGRRVEVVVKDSSIPFMRRSPDTVNIVKLYGDLDQPEAIVLARQQYESYFLQRPQMIKLLETELARSDMLYLGWSGSDPYFKLVFGELLSRFGPMMRPGYAVMFDVTDAQRDELARKQIWLVELPTGDRTAQLAGWLESLVPAATLSVTPVQINEGGMTCIEEHFKGRREDAAQVLAGYKASWYKFTRQSNAALFGADRLNTGPITDVEMRELLPTLGRIMCGRRWQGGCMLTVIMPRAYEERLMPLWKTIRDKLAADGWLEEAQESAVETSADADDGVIHETGPTSWNTGAIRDLLSAAFSDEELSTLCFDYFRPVYEDFGSGMSKGGKIQHLLDHCIRHEQIETLLSAVQRANPAQYRRYEDQLRS